MRSILLLAILGVAVADNACLMNFADVIRSCEGNHGAKWGWLCQRRVPSGTTPSTCPAIEVTLQADWNATDGPAAIKNKPELQQRLLALEQWGLGNVTSVQWSLQRDQNDQNAVVRDAGVDALPPSEQQCDDGSGSDRMYVAIGAACYNKTTKQIGVCRVDKSRPAFRGEFNHESGRLLWGDGIALLQDRSYASRPDYFYAYCESVPLSGFEALEARLDAVEWGPPVTYCTADEASDVRRNQCKGTSNSEHDYLLEGSACCAQDPRWKGAQYVYVHGTCTADKAPYVERYGTSGVRYFPTICKPNVQLRNWEAAAASITALQAPATQWVPAPGCDPISDPIMFQANCSNSEPGDVCCVNVPGDHSFYGKCVDWHDEAYCEGSARVLPWEANSMAIARLKTSNAGDTGDDTGGDTGDDTGGDTGGDTGDDTAWNHSDEQMRRSLQSAATIAADIEAVKRDNAAMKRENADMKRQSAETNRENAEMKRRLDALEALLASPGHVAEAPAA